MTELAASVASVPTASSGVTKKKFAAPPVKSACLACRAARTRCDGGKPCATCQSRNRDCVYTPSRRGGPRARKKPWVGLDEELKQLPDDVLAMLSQEPADAPRQPISLQNYVDPGAGLKHLEDWFQDSDFIFDSLFMNGNGPVGGNAFNADVYGAGAPPGGMVMARSYQSEAAILDAYYVFIHPYFPILPPPTHVPVDQPVPYPQNQFEVFGDGFKPSSPISLAISAILALIPCPDDVNFQSHDSQLFRRKYAQYLAQLSFETIEKDEDIPDSSVEPSKPLSEEHIHNFRRPFHPALPSELESIVALDILSVYEYAQRGNLKKMQNRAGQALMNAMEMGLHACNVEDRFCEGRRRVWWMTYTCVAQGAIVSNTKPSFTVFSPRFTTRLPQVASDPDAFPVYIQSQRAILAATQFVIELNKAVARENADMSPIYERMKELEAFMGPLLSQSETWVLAATTTSPVGPAEDVVARSLRCMAAIKLNSARIKLHRYCAFLDTPVFNRRHCDLKSLGAPDNNNSNNSNNNGDEPRLWPTCSCGALANPFGIGNDTGGGGGGGGGGGNSCGQPSPSSDGFGYGSTTTTIPASTPSVAGSSSSGPAATTTAHHPSDPHNPNYPSYPSYPSSFYPNAGGFPFTSHQSAKICLRSALNIAHSFDELPFPNPQGVAQRGPPCLLSPTSGIVCPRTMPSFACCAMQCAYALLMVYHKTRSMYPCPSDVGVGGPVSGGSDSGAVAVAGMGAAAGQGCGGPGGAAAAAAAGGGGGGGGVGVGVIGDRPLVVNNLLARLQQGLTSIYGTLSNYAMSFEALGGMRDQIRVAIEDSAAFTVPV